MADNGSGLIRCTCSGHGLSTGDVISLSTSSVSAYRNGYRVTYVDDNTFDLDNSTYSSGGTATFQKAVTVSGLTSGAAYRVSDYGDGAKLRCLLSFDSTCSGNVDGIYMIYGGNLSVTGYCVVFGALRYGAAIYYGSRLDAYAGCLREPGTQGVYAASWGHASILYGNARMGATDSSNDIRVTGGSIIAATGCAGGTYSTTNTVASTGIIMK
jgi:hypothetical protein